jgi:hypothetical protein
MLAHIFFHSLCEKSAGEHTLHGDERLPKKRANIIFF